MAHPVLECCWCTTDRSPSEGTKRTERTPSYASASAGVITLRRTGRKLRRVAIRLLPAESEKEAAAEPARVHVPRADSAAKVEIDLGAAVAQVETDVEVAS